MSLNLIDLMKEQLTGAVAGQIGQKFGMDESAATTGIGAILPTVLGGLMKQSSTAEGAEALSQTLDSDDYDGGLFDNLSGMLSGGGSDGLMGGLGDTVLKSLFGDKLASIAGIIGKVAGIGSDKSSSMLALLAPLVMSFLGKQKRSMGLDASGLSSLLMSQKDSVAESLPAGMSSALGLGSLGIQEPAPAAPAPQPQAQGGGGMLKLLIPLVVIGAIGFLAYKMIGPAGEAVQDAGEAVANVDLGDVDMGEVDLGVSVPDVTMPGADMTSQLTGVFDSYRETLTGVTDEASATAALPKLEEFNEKLGGMTEMAGKLPEVARTALGGKVSGLLEPLQGIIDKLYQIPGVQAILEPVVNGMMEKAKGLLPV